MSVFLHALAGFYLAGVVAWVSGAIYYDLGRQTRSGIGLVAVWLLAVLGTLVFLQSIPMTALLATAVFAPMFSWWLTQRPKVDRDWDPNFSRVCRFEIDGDRIIATNVRNTEYRSLTDYDLKYETREYRFSELHAADVLLLYWGSPWMCHPMLIFEFGPDQHLCFSIETRYQRGQPYDIVGSLYRQFELMYVVSDERDAILRRTKHAENQDCYLYRLQLDADTVRVLLDEYIDGTNRLHDTPRWYNSVTDNCTVSILKQRTEKVKLDRRIFFNGSLDRLLYERHRIDTSLPFAELKPISLINERANQATKSDFHQAIRHQLPGFKPR